MKLVYMKKLDYVDMKPLYEAVLNGWDKIK